MFPLQSVLFSAGSEPFSAQGRGACTASMNLLYLQCNRAFREATHHPYLYIPGLAPYCFPSHVHPSTGTSLSMRRTFGWLVLMTERRKKGLAGTSALDNTCVIPEGGIPAALRGPPAMEHRALCPDISPLTYLNSLCCSFSTIQKVVGMG